MTATAPRLAKGTGASPQAKFVTFRGELNAGLIERETQIDLCLTALISNHNPLFVGDPGTGKSMLGRAVADWLDGKQYEVLLSKFTDPSELFGPVSIEGLKKDEYRRITDNTILDAKVAFTDEIFKGSTAILNTLLGVFNERQYRNGKTMMKVPLVMAIAASNEWPQDGETGGKELGALFDRFLYRNVVKPIRSPEGVDRLLWAPKLEVVPSTKITPAEIDLARAEAAALDFSEPARAGFIEILRKLEEEGIFPGDRRKRWSVEAVKSFAYLDGSAEVKKDHLEVLAHTFWAVPGEQIEKTAQVVAKVANPLGMEITSLLTEARDAYKGWSGRKKDMKTGIPASVKLGEIVERLEKLAEKSAKAKAVFNHVEGMRKQLAVALV